MINVKTTCDKCGKEINGRIYRVDVGLTGDCQYAQIQMSAYQAYDICPECMKAVITDDVKGSPFKRFSSYVPTYCYCV